MNDNSNPLLGSTDPNAAVPIVAAAMGGYSNGVVHSGLFSFGNNINAAHDNVAAAIGGHPNGAVHSGSSSSENNNNAAHNNHQAALGNVLHEVNTKLSVSCYGEDELLSLIQTLYMKQAASRGYEDEDEWAEYKIKETNMFTVDKYQHGESEAGSSAGENELERLREQASVLRKELVKKNVYVKVLMVNLFELNVRRRMRM